MRRRLASIVVLLAVSGAPEAFARRSVVVVPMGQRQRYNDTARVATALRAALEARGRLAKSAAAALGPAAAAPTALLSSAREAVKEGVTLYDGLDFKKARAAFKTAVTQLRDALQQGATAKELRVEYVKAVHYLAAAAFYDNDRKAAATHFGEAVGFAPTLKPDENTFSPDVLKVYEEVIGASQSVGSLNVTSKPAAEVTLNGEPAGVAPVVLSNVRPGSHLVGFRRAGYERDAQWVVVTPGGRADVQTELRALPQKAVYLQALADARAELNAPAPGPATTRLAKMLSTESVILVSARVGGAVLTVWADEGRWTKRHQAIVAEGGEQAYASEFLEAQAVPVAGCTGPTDCGVGRECQGGVCVAVPGTTPTPVYKKWWFWTIIGVAVAGGVATGVVLGTRRDEWTAVLHGGAMQ